jgi:hypothetical protein
MTKLAFSVLGGFLLVFGASRAAAQQSAPLPLKRVRLYETGVGYFERSGTLGRAAAELPVPAGHLDDALKTLVVLTQDPSATVTGLEFGSSVSRGMARAMAGLPVDDTPLKLHSLLRALRGAGVVVNTKNAPLTGRLVELVEEEESDLERCVKVPGAKDGGERAECVMKKSAALVLLGNDGEIRRLSIDEVISVRPTDKSFATRLGITLDALGDQSARLKKALRVHATNAPSISLGYVAEAPVWRTTYRLVLEEAKDRGSLQGFALLHNDTDEDWKRVQVELVNGKPDSFLFPLAAPRYARRELVVPEDELSTVPQLMDTTADRLWGDEIGDSFGAGGLGLSGIGTSGGGRGQGFGMGHGRLGQSTAASTALSVGNLAGIAAAEGLEGGALFRYKLPSLIDLSANASALVPFVNNHVRVKRIAAFSDVDSPARSAVFLIHEGNQTLPGGTIAVFADGGFAGEATLDRMKPKQSTIVEFGLDLDVELTAIDARAEKEIKLTEFADRRLRVHYVKHSTRELKIENKSSSGRDIFVKLTLANNAKVTGADELAYDSIAGSALAVFRVGARERKVRLLRADEGLSDAYDFNSLSARALAGLIAGKSLPPAQKAILTEAWRRLFEAEAGRAMVKRHQAELIELTNEIVRLREHVRALYGRDSDAADAVVERLLLAERRAKQLSGWIAALRAEARAKSQAAERTLRRLGARG